MKSKLFFVIIIALTLVFTIIACENQEAETPPPQGDAAAPTPDQEGEDPPEAAPVESDDDIPGELRVVEFWSMLGGGDGAQKAEMIEEFNAQHAGNIEIVATTQDWGQYYVILRTAILGGMAPDLALSHDDFVNGLVREGAIVSLSEAVERTGIPIDFANYAVVTQRLRDMTGDYYAVPLDLLQILLSYNRELVGQAGLLDDDGNLIMEPGMDGFLAAVQTMDEALDVPGFSMGISGSVPMYLFNALYYQFGGQDYLVNDTGDTWIADRDSSLQALVAYQQIHQSGLPNVTNLGELFTTGQVAMVIDGAWQMNFFFENLGEDYGVRNLPLFGDTYYTTIHSHMFVLPFKPERAVPIEAAAIEFINWFAQNNATFARAGSVPAYIPQQTSELFLSFPMHAYFRDAVNYPARFNGTTPFALKGSAEVNESLNLLATGELTPEQALDELISRLHASIR